MILAATAMACLLTAGEIRTEERLLDGLAIVSQQPEGSYRDGRGVPEPEELVLFGLAIGIVILGLTLSMGLFAWQFVRKERRPAALFGKSLIPLGCAVVVTAPVLLLLVAWIAHWCFGDRAWWPKT